MPRRKLARVDEDRALTAQAIVVLRRLLGAVEAGDMAGSVAMRGAIVGALAILGDPSILDQPRLRT